ncbi:MAG: ABC transporter ATP-binding protein [Longimicrobiales bacterium]
MSALFAARDLHYHYPVHTQDAVRAITLTLPAGEVCAILGPNGSGKSTLLKLLLGVLEPTIGSAHYRDRPATAWDRRALAREIGVVPQLEDVLFPFAVRELVAMGRYPHLGPWQSERNIDRQAIAQAMARCAVTDLAERSMFQLSGGERQRVRVARALAQEPRTLVLDEPTAALDIAHEMALFELIAELCVRDGVTVIAATHNLNLAARFASRIVLLSDGALAAQGAPAEVLTSTTIETVYRWPVRVLQHAGPGPDRGAPQVVPLRMERPSNAPTHQAENP